MFSYNFINLIAAALTFFFGVMSIVNDNLWLSTLCFFGACVCFVIAYIKGKRKK
ncbi:MAG: hypothetical protein IJ306_00050 [Oscillospiraceae bacterium]|nr:hypothetical protein [Oscillospiraceae bacterium]